MTIMIGQDTRRLELASKFYRALGDASRLKILDALLDGEKNVGELVEIVGSSQGRVSNHLACLKQCGFVDTRRDGKYVYYRIADGQVRQLLELSQQMLAKNAERIWACTRVDMPEEQGDACPAAGTLERCADMADEPGRETE